MGAQRARDERTMRKTAKAWECYPPTLAASHHTRIARPVRASQPPAARRGNGTAAATSHRDDVPGPERVATSGPYAKGVNPSGDTSCVAIV